MYMYSFPSVLKELMSPIYMKNIKNKNLERGR